MKKESIQHNINFEELSQAVKNKRLESQEFVGFSDKEILKHILTENHTEYKDLNKSIAQEDNLKPSSHIDDPQNNFFPEYAKDAPDDTKDTVSKLINLTLKKGLPAGFRAVKKYDPFIIDMYHDAIADKLVNYMKEKKLI